MNPKIFVGVDISKLTLDLALLHGINTVRTFKIKNSEEEVKAFLKTIREEYKFKNYEIVFCAEDMGMFASFLSKVLIKHKIPVCFESALQIKKSLGIQRGKNDKIDSIRIVEYAKKNFQSLKVWEPPRQCLERLKKLATIRKRLLKVRTMLVNEEKLRTYYLGKDEIRDLNSCYGSSLASINADIVKIEETMLSIIGSDQRLTTLMSLITSVPYVGNTIALQVIISTNEFRNITSPKKFASYCGVAPFEWSSGNSVTGRTKVSHFANKDIKANLHLAAMSSVRSSTSSLKEYYLRKQAEGKNNMSILNAIRNKLISRIFACVNSEKPFVEY